MWHRAAVEWWVALDPDDGREDASENGPGDLSVVPILSEPELGVGSYPSSQMASGVSLTSGIDTITLHADEAGWAWLRIPWDPGWSSLAHTPVHKGGPGHLVVWVEQGTTEMRWGVSNAVDVASAGVTGLALLATAVLSVMNRRRGWQSDP